MPGMNALLADRTLAPPSLLFQRLLSLVFFATTAYAVADYPFARVFLGVLLAAYTVCLLAQPAAWLLLLPIVLPLVNLAPWSGRFYLEDFDFFVWATLASALWQGAYSLSVRPRFTAAPWLLIAFFLTTHCIAAVRGLLPFAALDANAFNNYYSHYNALRVGKSLLWAVLLIPPLLRAFAGNPERARNYLSLGVCLGLIGTGCAVLWERGVLSDLLYGESIYAKLRDLTDFSSDYRITGLFSEMHTGGEAIDGYLAMAWPFALGSLATDGSRWRMGIGTMALLAGLYSALVTFSRGTYLAVAVSLLAFAVSYSTDFLRSGVSAQGYWPVPLILLGTVVACALLYGKGGYYAMIAALGILGGAVVLSFLKSLRRDLRAMLLAGLFLAGFALMMRGLVTSKWVNNGLAESLAICLPLSVALLLAGLFVGNRAREIFKLRGLGISLIFAVTLIAVCVPSLSGSYMKARFSTVEGDAGGRMEHWKHAVSLMDSSWDTFAFGMGLGVFPHAYLWGKETEKSSIAALQKQEGRANTYLQLSNSMDLAMGQRISLEAGEPYTLSLDAKAQAKNSSLEISICRRHIIAPWDSECVSTTKTIESSRWQHLDWAFNIGAVGDSFRLGRRPLVLRITHFHYGPQSDNNLPLDFIGIDNLKLLDRYGEDHLINGNFKAGLDNWYPSSDHYHLPLHIKNLWVNVYFEQGLLGLFAFGALSFYALACGVRLAKRGDLFALTLLSSLLGAFSVGLIGTLYDVPRVIFFFFLLLFALLAQDPAHWSVAPKNRHPDHAKLPGSPARRGSFVKPPFKTS